MAIDDTPVGVGVHLPGSWRAQVWTVHDSCDSTRELVEAALGTHAVEVGAGGSPAADPPSGGVWDCAVVVGAGRLAQAVDDLSPRIPLVLVLCPQDLRGRRLVATLAGLARRAAEVNLVMLPDDGAVRRVVSSGVPVPLVVHHCDPLIVRAWALRAHAYGGRSRRRPLVMTPPR